MNLSTSDPRELREFYAAEIAAGKASLARIVSEEGGTDSTTVLHSLDDLIARLGDARRVIGLLRSVHPDSDLRKEAEQGEQQLAKLFTDLSLDRDLFEVVKTTDPSGLDETGKRMRDHVLRDFHRAGVDRDESTREEVRGLRTELVELGQEFARNILSDVRSIALDDASELEGLPDDFIRSHVPGDDGKIEITTDYPDYNPFMSYARNAERREELYRKFRSRAYPQNAPILKKTLALRHRLATLLGYDSWADYATEDKMIRKAAAIGEFIERVSDAADETSTREYAELLETKRASVADATEVFDWERSYFEEIRLNEHYHVDSRELRPYFSYAAISRGVLDLGERLFEVEFRVVPDAPRWHADVEVLDIYEKGERVGRVYLDMHPREGKFKHAAMFPLVQGVQGRRLPEAVLVCNFPRPQADTGGEDTDPGLLEHSDVVTFLHEFGHLLHHIFGREVDWVEFSGTGTEWDFVEVPSQLMEEWAWDTEVLQGFARHYETGEVIPGDLVDRLRKARDFGRALHVRQQMFYSSLSLRLHYGDMSDVDLNALQRDLQNRYSRFRHVDNTYFYASFGHLDGYSALYYTYMWSLVIEKDLFSRFCEHGLLDRETAQHYRETILARGGSKDGADLVRDFLGRDYDFDAFAEWLKGTEQEPTPSDTLNSGSA